MSVYNLMYFKVDCHSLFGGIGKFLVSHFS